ncbi:hypothetical protein L2E82_33397 [Cichorium intybus]|uniref:Uncharacterized protein n=1 Tax=Cichorium intybus TaxID=13427 RepID=A0ACB9BK24_CICIN|nr:hypothetical protein L2E82_33397 [Cichorium intybus]
MFLFRIIEKKPITLIENNNYIIPFCQFSIAYGKSTVGQWDLPMDLESLFNSGLNSVGSQQPAAKPLCCLFIS